VRLPVAHEILDDAAARLAARVQLVRDRRRDPHDAAIKGKWWSLKID
jgi:hypothetical protein